MAETTVDGVYGTRNRDRMRFRRLPAPDDAEVERMMRDIVRRLRWLLRAANNRVPLRR